MNTTKVSVVIPARNEEVNLPRLLKSLENLDYPKDSLEIILGNDNSEDKTAEILNNFAQDKPFVKVVHLSENRETNLKGKTRVLAELIKNCSGEIVFFTDADIRISSNWIKGMLPYFEENTGVVIGATAFEERNLFEKLQSMEWLSILSICKIASIFNIPSTGLGNNMAIRKSAYDKIGGYEKLGFHIIEDYALYTEIIKNKYDFTHVLNKDILSYTLAPSNYLEQRSRWIKGVVQSSFLGTILGLIQAFLGVFCLLMLFFIPKIAISVFLSQVVFYGCIMLFFQYKIQSKRYSKYFPIFIVYISFAWLFQLFYYLFNKKVFWKGRSYF